MSITYYKLSLLLKIIKSAPAYRKKAFLMVGKWFCSTITPDFKFLIVSWYIFVYRHFHKSQVASSVLSFLDYSLLWEKNRCIDIFWLLLCKWLYTGCRQEISYVVCNAFAIFIDLRSRPAEKKILQFYFKFSQRNDACTVKHRFKSVPP